MFFKGKKYKLIGDYIEYDNSGNAAKMVSFQLIGNRNPFGRISGEISESSNGIPEISVIEQGFLSRKIMSFKKVYRNFWYYNEENQMKNFENIKTEIHYRGSYDRDKKMFVGRWYCMEREVEFKDEEYMLPGFEGSWEGEVEFLH